MKSKRKVEYCDINIGKINNFDGAPQIILHFGGTNNISPIVEQTVIELLWQNI